MGRTVSGRDVRTAIGSLGPTRREPTSRSDSEPPRDDVFPTPLQIASRTFLVTFAFGVVLGTSCSDDDRPSEQRPTMDELDALFEHLCMLRESCEQAWDENDSIEKCVSDNVNAYKDQPTECLNDVVDYYECVNDVGDQSCARFVEHNPPLACSDLQLVAGNTCEGNVGF